MSVVIPAGTDVSGPSPLPVPAEREVIRKERASGSYHLSAYYLAKTLSELPLLLAVPSIFHIVVYWVASLNISPTAFFGSWLVILIDSFAAQVSVAWCCYSLCLRVASYCIPSPSVLGAANRCNCGGFEEGHGCRRGGDANQPPCGWILHQELPSLAVLDPVLVLRHLLLQWSSAAHLHL